MAFKVSVQGQLLPLFWAELRLNTIALGACGGGRFSSDGRKERRGEIEISCTLQTCMTTDLLSLTKPHLLSSNSAMKSLTD
jgi:hypothetical protein